MIERSAYLIGSGEQPSEQSMTQVLSNDQVTQIIQTTMIVLLARPELKPDWQINLAALLQQARDEELEDEMLFVAAVLSLLHSPGDTLPTGTVYDSAWRALLSALQTGIVQEVGESESESFTLENLLESVAQAVVTIMRHEPSRAGQLAEEVRAIRSSSVEAGIEPLVTWLDDVLLLLDGRSPATLNSRHTEMFERYWRFIVDRLG